MSEIHIISLSFTAFLTASAWFITVLETEYKVALELLRELKNSKS